MSLTQQEKDIIQKIAEISACHWFEFATDDYGEDCVLHKIKNKKFKLADGIFEMFMYNPDVCYLLSTEDLYVKFVQDENGQISMINTNKNIEIISSMSFENLIERYPDVEQLNNLLPVEERKIAYLVLNKVRFRRKFNFERATELLYNAISIIEGKESGNSILDSDTNKRLNIYSTEYRLLKQFVGNEENF